MSRNGRRYICSLTGSRKPLAWNLISGRLRSRSIIVLIPRIAYEVLSPTVIQSFSDFRSYNLKAMVVGAKEPAKAPILAPS